MPLIALIENEIEDSNSYAEALRAAEIDVDQFFTVDEAIDGIQQKEYDAYLLDLEFDYVKFDGLRTVESIKERINKLSNGFKQIPILVVSGHPPDEYKEISQYFFNAWDYMQKPVDTRNLVGKTKLLLRFAEDVRIGIPISSSSNVEFRNTEVYWNNKLVSPMPMTLYKYVHCLVENKGHDVSFGELHDLTSSHETDRMKKRNAVRAHIKRLRESFLNVDPEFNNIQPVHGKGYKWVS